MSASLPFVAAPESRVWEAAKVVVRNDPELKRVVKQFRLWEGTALDVEDWPPQAPNLPAIRLSPAPDRSGWFSEGQHRSNLAVAVDIAIGGTDVLDLLNFWNAIRGAFYPQDEARRDYVDGLFDARAVRAELTGTPFTTQLVEDESIMVSTGKITFTIIVNT